MWRVDALACKTSEWQSVEHVIFSQRHFQATAEKDDAFDRGCRGATWSDFFATLCYAAMLFQENQECKKKTQSRNGMSQRQGIFSFSMSECIVNV